MNANEIVTNTPDPLTVCTVTVYDCSTGLIKGVFACQHGQLACNVPEGCDYVDGRHDSRNRKVDVATKTVVPYVPPAPSDDHVWDEAAEEWAIPAQRVKELAMDKEARAVIAATEASTLRAIRDWILSGGSDQAALAKLAQAEEDITSKRGDIIDKGK